MREVDFEIEKGMWELLRRPFALLCHMTSFLCIPHFFSLYTLLFVFIVSHFVFGDCSRLLSSASFELSLPQRFGGGESNLTSYVHSFPSELLASHTHSRTGSQFTFIKSSKMLNTNTSPSFSLRRRCIN